MALKDSDSPPARPAVIGILGKAFAGKTTLAKQLEARGWKRVRFGGPVKEMLKVLGLTDAQVDGDEKEVPLEILGGQTSRHAQRSLGTDWGRDTIHPDLWANVWLATVKKHLAAGHNVVCDDVRFPNELQAVRILGATVVRVRRPNGPKSKFPNHISETLMGRVKVDLALNNDGTPADLFNKLAKAFPGSFGTRTPQPHYTVADLTPTRGNDINLGYRANLYRDGRQVATILDAGRGAVMLSWVDSNRKKVPMAIYGSGNSYLAKGTPEEAKFHRSLNDFYEAYLGDRSTPADTAGAFPSMQSHLRSMARDHFCHEEACRILKGNCFVGITAAGRIRRWGTELPVTPENRAAILKKTRGVTILNNLTVSEAASLLRVAA
jgi:hypothetical protein